MGPDVSAESHFQILSGQITSRRNVLKQKMKDQVFDVPPESVGDFAFDENVAAVFPDMISRSVPGYASILAMIGQLAETFAKPKTNVYDLGCSLGAATLSMRKRIPKSCTIYAVDSSTAMIAGLTNALKATPAGCPVEVVEDDIAETAFSQASFVVLNFTLQFVAESRREEIVTRIYEAMVPNAALLLSEKISFKNHGQQELMVKLHHDFKRAHGYSDLEIANKRTALENTLIPESMETHVDRLRKAGFQTVAPWFQCFNFASILAVKSDA